MIDRDWWGRWEEDRAPEVQARQVCDMCGQDRKCWTFRVGDGSQHRQALCVTCLARALIDLIAGHIRSR